MTRKNWLTTVAAVLVTVVFSAAAQAQSSPIQLSLVTPIQIVPPEKSIGGFRFNLIYGRNTSVVGLDLGLVNHTTSGVSKGLQWGIVALADADFNGWQAHWVNISGGRVEGLQTGLYNTAGSMSGVQLGIVNHAGSMHGLQIGLVNIIKTGGQFPVFPIVNWSF
ncbi:MAG: hypothetical protein KAJ12_12900 [Bacteroidetes bacterium]|nr:hypothetical protein [Bacteroidota bacterium]